MKKRPNPAKLIKQRARKLKLHQCFVNADWKEDKLAHVIVSRKHTNGNFTVCLYLVDLLCMGVKDTSYRFNIEKEEFEGLVEDAQTGANFMEVDYDLAHNIIYAGYEFALDCGIKPHKDFEKTTKFMLEKDDERVPLIDIECGERGKPHYFQSEFENGTFVAKVLHKLEENVGKGNFFVTLARDIEDDDERGTLEHTEEDVDFLEALKDDDLNIEEVAHEFINFLNKEVEKEGELSEEEEFKFSVCFKLLTNHYTDKEKFERMTALWEPDTAVEPSFPYEKGLSEETNTKIDAILDKEEALELSDINFLKQNLSSQALADYIIFKANIETNSENHDYKSKETKAFKKKHPNFPLFKMQSQLEELVPEQLTLENIFENDQGLSAYEFEEYLFLKLSALVFLKDITAIIAYEYILEGTAIDDDYYDFITEHLNKIALIILSYNVILDFGKR